MMRTPPLRMEPAPLSPGDSVQFAESRRWWKVRATNERYAVLTSPYNLPNRYGLRNFYSLIDWERGVRGPDDHYGFNTYETDAEVAAAVQALLNGEIEVSWRAHSIRVRITQIHPTP